MSSLQAYSFYLKTVSASELQKTEEYHRKIISSSKFWKLAKHDVPLIKVSFFSALTALVNHTNSIVCEEKKKILTTVMNSLEENDPALLAVVWETLLTAINKIEVSHVLYI